MQLFGWTLTRTPPRREIARPRASQEPLEASGVLERLNRLETTVERLELDGADRQLAVLTSVEKVMHQLRARERKRERDASDNGDEPSHVPDQGFPIPEVATPSHTTAHLARRFRGF